MAHLLIVDDEQDIRVMMEAVLSRAGHTVEAVGSGTEAVRAVIEMAGRGQFYDLCIADVSMVDMSGYQVLEEVAKVAPETKLAIFTANGDILGHGRAVLSGAKFWEKPMDGPQLISKVAEALEVQP